MTYMEIVQFLRDNWQFISTGILTLLSIILMIIKKRPNTVKAVLQDQEIYEKIVKWINMAESAFGSGHGKEKLNFVLDKFSKEENAVDDMWYWQEPITNTVNLILSTPQKKKGVKNGKK